MCPCISHTCEDVSVQMCASVHPTHKCDDVSVCICMHFKHKCNDSSVHTSRVTGECLSDILAKPLISPGKKHYQVLPRSKFDQ